MATDQWQAAVASADGYELGEGPLWDAPRGRILWVDVNAGTVHEGRLDGDQVVRTRSHRIDRTVGAVVCSPAGDLLVAGAHALTVVLSGEHRAGPAVVASGSRRRLNDGTCDPAGNLLIGTLALDDSRGGESLLRIERDATVTVLDDDLTLSNGLAFDPAGTTLYSVDSVPGVVWARSYDAATGATGPRREWLRITDGLPDGLCADAEGHLWIAIWGAGQVRRYTPDARLAGVVEVPAPHTTSVAFVGDDLDRLLITTATAGLDAEVLTAYPSSGRLFLADVGVSGLPVTAWAGPAVV
ncbi:SMP-30/gluconolactonase/LRE family protein [Actinoplanes sp. NPDC051494]|uniref:SMP-30/gluconolactonase/LRE family protein n=1 Tax=Actinoplanes sp. NPDC051494 TaxID=3363907 RepID=UPI003790ED5A